MTKIDIFSGFLGAGKTTLIRKMITEAYKGEQVVLIENEFGEIGIDGGFLQDAGVKINEMNSGCICCSLVGDFAKALKQVIAEYNPDRVVIEPSGVGKLSDVIRAVQKASCEGASLNSFTTVVDVNKCKMYMKNFGEFFNDQVENAGCIILSHTGTASDKKIDEVVSMLREHNATAVIVTTDWPKLDGAQILQAMERTDTLEAELERLASQGSGHHHHHHDGEECDDPDCCCHHHHDDDDDDEDEHEHHHHHHDDDDDDEDEHEHHHHHHDDDDDEDEHEHHHHHHHDDDDDEHEHHHHHHDDDDDDDEHEHHHHHHDGEECDDPDCCCHHHHHHHGHDADEVFVSWGTETAKKFTADEIRTVLEKFAAGNEYGMVLRAKGIVAGADGQWIHFDYVPGEPDVRTGSAGITGRLCVIGSGLKESEIANLFGV